MSDEQLPLGQERKPRIEKDHIPGERKTPRELADIFAANGDFPSLVAMYANGELTGMEEVEVRGLMATSYEKAAEKLDRVVTENLPPEAAWSDGEMAELLATAPGDWRRKAWEIRFNEQGLSLEEQLKDHFPNLFGDKGGFETE